ELTLALAAVAIGILAGLDDRLLGDPVDLAAGTGVALRLVHYLLVSGVRLHTTFYSCHGSILSPEPCLDVRKHATNERDIRLMDHRGRTELTLALAALLGEDMAQMGLATLEPAGAGF